MHLDEGDLQREFIDLFLSLFMSFESLRAISALLREAMLCVLMNPSELE